MTKVTRDKDRCLSRLVVDKSGMVLTKESCRIQLPTRWMDIKMGNITEVTTVYGFFPILFNDNSYCVISVCAMMDLLPSRITKITVEEESYYEFHFDAGTPVIKSLKLVKSDTLTFNVLDEFILKGKVPWWTTVDDLCDIFGTANKHAGSSINKVPQTIEFLVGVIARRTEERAKSLRQTSTSWKDYELENIEFIPLRSVLYSVNNTASKLTGAFFHEGVISAIVNPVSKTGKIETLLRS